LGAIALCVAGVCFAETIDFDKANAGSAPPGWTVAMTHKGGARTWEVLKDDCEFSARLRDVFRG